jgi:hypothetical protein
VAAAGQVTEVAQVVLEAQVAQEVRAGRVAVDIIKPVI